MILEVMAKHQLLSLKLPSKKLKQKSHKTLEEKVSLQIQRLKLKH
jgi:hypothetical protein